MTTTAGREEILTNITKIVKEKFINPNDLDQDLDVWESKAAERRPAIVNAADDAEFEKEVRLLLAQLGASHTAFFHGSGNGIPAPHAISATLTAFETDRGNRLVFEDVVEDGIAFRAGIGPGDILLGQDDREIVPPQAPLFALGKKHTLRVVPRGGSCERTVEIELPVKGAKDRPPMIEPKSVAYKVLPGGVGLLKIASFPGASGRVFAQRLDHAVSELLKARCDRLLIDLRGNIGGGIGSLRLMSYLTPAKVPIGYSLTRRRLKEGFSKESLPKISRLPGGRVAEIAMAIRFGVLQKDRSVAMETEGLGPRPFHGRMAMIINEHSHSAAEMVAAFASTNNLVHTVGHRTAGEVLGGANFRVGSEYRVRIPIAGWYTWTGCPIEAVGVVPKTTVDLTLQSLKEERDPQMDTALEALRA
jgi:carboxyl-terminal processing protease